MFVCAGLVKTEESRILKLGVLVEGLSICAVRYEQTLLLFLSQLRNIGADAGFAKAGYPISRVRGLLFIYQSTRREFFE